MQNDDRGYCRKAVKAIKKDYRGFDKDMETAFNLLSDLFCPDTQEEPVKPGRFLHRITGNDAYEVWKFNVAVQGSRLKPGQWPRLWFGVMLQAKLIVPLVMARHKDYGSGDAEQENEALALMADYTKIEES